MEFSCYLRSLLAVKAKLSCGIIRMYHENLNTRDFSYVLTKVSSGERVGEPNLSLNSEKG